MKNNLGTINSAFASTTLNIEVDEVTTFALCYLGEYSKVKSLRIRIISKGAVTQSNIVTF